MVNWEIIRVELNYTQGGQDAIFYFSFFNKCIDFLFIDKFSTGVGVFGFLCGYNYHPLSRQHSTTGLNRGKKEQIQRQI